MAFGITDNGFNLKRFEDIKQELANKYREVFGDIRTDAESNFGQIINIQSETLALLWEMIQESYYAKYPSSASGVALDWAVELNNIKRLPSTGTNVAVGIEISGTSANITDGFEVIDSNDNTYRVDSGGIVDLNSNTKSVIQITSDSSGTYLVFVKGVAISVTVPVPTIISDIVIALNNEIETVLPEIETIIGDDYIIISDDEPFSLESGFGTGIKLFVVKSFTNIDVGKKPVSIKDISTIATPISGVLSVLNFESGIVGNDIERDDDLRVRRRRLLNSAGTATIEAIRAGILRDVPDVTTVLVVENDDDIIIGSMPPKSIQCIVVGGDDVKIAEAIFKYKCAGIQAYGNQGIFNIADSMGYLHQISFSRPITKRVYVDVEITKNNEEILPVDYQLKIRKILSKYSFTIGEDVIVQRLISKIYNEIDGIANINLYVDLASNPTQEDNIEIGFDEIANIDENDVAVFLA